MTKIMLVEDDKSLREIYSIRLVAEGYDIVSAGDGEEALAMAVREKPDLIISDVMMPKISGFDMLDILRSTEETRAIKIIMMTALSSEDQRRRGENLGADMYLVKSQVGIEDVINAVHMILGDKPVTNASANLNTVAAITPTQAPVKAPVQAVTQTPTQVAVQSQVAKPAPTQQNPAQAQSTAQPPVVTQPPQPVQTAQVVAPQQVAFQPPVAVAPVVSQPAPVPQATPVSVPPVVAPIAEASRTKEKVLRPLENTANTAGAVSMEQRIAQELGENNAPTAQ